MLMGCIASLSSFFCSICRSCLGFFLLLGFGSSCGPPCSLRCSFWRGRLACDLVFLRILLRIRRLTLGAAPPTSVGPVVFFARGGILLSLCATGKTAKLVVVVDEDEFEVTVPSVCAATTSDPQSEACHDFWPQSRDFEARAAFSTVHSHLTTAAFLLLYIRPHSTVYRRGVHSFKDQVTGTTGIGRW